VSTVHTGGTVVDQARPVRAGEELDEARLAPWLRAQLGAAPDAPVTVAQFPGGHSNLTYLVTVAGKEYALRRPPFGSKVKSAHDMGREVRVLSKLAPIWPQAPRPVAWCDDETLLGARFYVMERIPGVILRREPPRDLVLDEATCTRLCERFIDNLADLHAIDYQAAGLGDFGKPDGYVQRQVSGWTQRYADARTDDIPDVDAMAAWLAAHLPATSPAPTILHNDYKFDNLILDPGDVTRIIGVLDWEMATLGDPLMDLGTTLCYWVEPGDPDLMRMMRFGPTTLPGMLSRRQLAERYAARTGRDLGGIVFYYCFGLFKTAVVAQQIHFRWKQGLTKDERFGQLIYAIRALAAHAVASTGRSSL
jgi:aminoglycoside phosphotransferase (APT) family kinase protein